MNGRYILDACAVIAFLSKEPGSLEVLSLLRRAEADEAKVFMHNLNLLEVYYGLRRAYGDSAASVRLSYIRCLPITFIPQVGGNSFIEAGRLKASYRISLADAVLLSEACVSESTVVTADHHELDFVEKNEHIQFLWIR